MPDTGVKYAATAANNTGRGVNAWINPSNATGSSAYGGASYANCTIPVNVDGDPLDSNYIWLTNYSVGLSGSASILGIVVELNASSNDPTANLRIQILKAGALAGTQKTNTTFGSGTYGSSADLWGTTWTESDINNTGFGVSIFSTSSDSITNVLLYGARITVHYSSGGAPGSSLAGHFLFM
jgi:hypothetical protein